MGLRQSDLEFTVDPVFEIDSYKSKMGDDEDIVVLSFSVNGEQPAKDLVNFVETRSKGQWGICSSPLRGDRDNSASVSYTHLTLPTSDLV